MRIDDAVEGAPGNLRRFVVNICHRVIISGSGLEAAVLDARRGC